VLRRRDIGTLPSISDRVSTAFEDERLSTARPTETDRASYALAAEDFAKAQADLRRLVEVDLVSLERDLDAAGAPWTPGRLPAWSPDQK
jgi:hypothetical protein